MLTVALSLAVLLCAAVVWAWLAAERTVRELRVQNRHLRERNTGYRAELEALTLCGPTVEQRVIAALNPDAHQQTLSDAWLAYVDSLPTTHDRENPL